MVGGEEESVQLFNLCFDISIRSCLLKYQRLKFNNSYQNTKTSGTGPREIASSVTLHN